MNNCLPLSNLLMMTLSVALDPQPIFPMMMKSLDPLAAHLMMTIKCDYGIYPPLFYILDSQRYFHYDSNHIHHILKVVLLQALVQAL